MSEEKEGVMGREEEIEKVFQTNGESFGVVGLAWRVHCSPSSSSSSLSSSSSSSSSSLFSKGVYGVYEEREGEEREEMRDGDDGGDGLLWHWGSCAKSLSATVVGCLIDDGKFKNGWQTKISEVFCVCSNSSSPFPSPSPSPSPSSSSSSSSSSPSLCIGCRKQTKCIGKEIGEITLMQLAHHRSGLLADIENEEEEKLSLLFEKENLSVQEKRKRFVEIVLREKELEHHPGERYGPYSNVGYVVLAWLVETYLSSSSSSSSSSSLSWEELVMDLVVRPLGMSSFGFGVMKETPERKIPIGHDEDGKGVRKDDNVWMHSSFSVHSTLEDWEKFALLHYNFMVNGKNETKVKISPSALTLLHTPASPAVPNEPWDGTEPANGYAMAWKTLWEETSPETVVSSPTGLLWHFGTNFRYNAGIYLDAKLKVLLLVASNSGSMVTRLAVRFAMEQVREIATKEIESSSIAFHEQNRLSWNAATTQHRTHKPNLVEQYAVHKYNNLFPEDMVLLGDLKGKSVVHLQCNDGQDTISMVLHKKPRFCIGVDISDTACEFARELVGAVEKNRKENESEQQQETTTTTSFVRSDVITFCELARIKREEIGGEEFSKEDREAALHLQEHGADVVYASYGAICWISDLPRWAKGISSLLAKGGKFVLVEFHPFATSLNPKTYKIESGMIGGVMEDWDGVGDYIANDYDFTWKNPQKSFEFCYGIGDVVSSLLGAGLVLESLTEYPYINGYECMAGMQIRDKDDCNCRQWVAPSVFPQNVPLMYSVVARKL